ncbi:Rnf-Nqr domain containing protein [Pseudomonas vancouverensis]|uniref:NADH:quinone oxidoreductase n=1 Tax=Pseudomonas vancouverensis TaxID=95300 RepID=A0A1H2P836_PSEVA|nr:Rnf-Nqr domain containing protein [Pseudomonas vancouverensis]KAB0500224.1 NADH:quinone oxidoreductase [Pseudomonas vancouverensis]TDB68713.1 NADH:quinone oxidoreductase [Pseudomonas vancouverensis]SDV13824.1 electron transport complex protein RnfE [Pseudomonas vancouverensis]
MSRSFTLLNSLMLTPLLGATGSLVTALGLWLMFTVVTCAFGLCMGFLRSRLAPATHLLAAIFIAATLTSCVQLLLQAWSLPWQQQLGIYAALIALQCLVLEHGGFFQTTWPERLRLTGVLGALMMTLGVLREIIGGGTLGSHLTWLFANASPDWHGWILLTDGGLRLVTLLPGGFILLGLLIAAWQAWRSTPSH